MSAIPSWCRVGVQCVCIEDDWRFNMLDWLGIAAPDRVPMLHEVLTIREVHANAFGSNECHLTFEGIPEFLYASRCFRPLVTLEDDMAAHFTRLLDAPAPTERERA